MLVLAAVLVLVLVLVLVQVLVLIWEGGFNSVGGMNIEQIQYGETRGSNMDTHGRHLGQEG